MQNPKKWWPADYHLHLPRVHDKAHAIHWLQEHLHLVYFGGVFYESHGLYGWAALALLILGILALFVGSEEEA